MLETLVEGRLGGLPAGAAGSLSVIARSGRIGAEEGARSLLNVRRAARRTGAVCIGGPAADYVEAGSTSWPDARGGRRRR